MNKFYSIYDAEIDVTRHTASKTWPRRFLKTSRELKNPKFEETHMIKQSLPKEVRENMSKEQLQAMPILGGLRALPNTRGDATATCNAPSVEFDNTDDLPF